MPVAPDDDNAWPCRPQASLAALLDAATAAVAQLAGQADLDRMADQDAAAVMGALTTLTGRLDGLRVQVARAVRDRDICRLRGARNLAGWLRADDRLADDAWKIARLARAGPGLPQSPPCSARARSAWPRQPPPAGRSPSCQPFPARPPSSPQPNPAPLQPNPIPLQPSPAATPHPSLAALQPSPGPDGTAGSGSPAGLHSAPDDSAAGPCAQLPAGVDPSGEEAWAGLWRAGDVHAAADALFATVLPALDGAQLRQLGAHLRETADARDRATEDCDAYVRRSLRNLPLAARHRRDLRTAAPRGRRAGHRRLRVPRPQDWPGRRPDQGPALGRRARLAHRCRPQPLRPAHRCRPSHTAQLAATRHTAQLTAASPATPPAHRCQPRPHRPAHHCRPQPHRPASRSAQPGGRHRSRRDARTAGRLWRRGRRPAQPCPRVHRARPRRPGPRRRRRTRQPCSASPPRRTGPGRLPAAPDHRHRALVHPARPAAGLRRHPRPRHPAHRRSRAPPGLRRRGHPPGHQPNPLSAIGAPGNATAQLTRLLAAAIADLPPPLATPSAVLDIGRKSPGWTPRQRDALHAQYGGRCGFGRCDGPIDVIHHIIHWLHGGKTRIINGFPCCLYHHWLIHEGGWRIKKHPGGTITTCPPPPGWRPGTIYRRGKAVREHPAQPGASRKPR